MTSTTYATKKEVCALIIELCEANSARMNKGQMCAPFNTSHLMGDMKKRGMPFPENYIEYCNWLKDMGAPQVCRKLAKQGHWIKGLEDLARKFHESKAQPLLNWAG